MIIDYALEVLILIAVTAMEWRASGRLAAIEYRIAALEAVHSEADDE